jgi:hypothetical protein
MSDTTIPDLSEINRTLDPGGDIVHRFLAECFTVHEMERGMAIFRLKHRLADEVERLIAIIDALDGDSDIEYNFTNGDLDPRLDECEADIELNEPSLAATTQLNHDEAGWDTPIYIHSDDLEFDPTDQLTPFAYDSAQ